MGKKKGNIMILMIAFLFFFSSFIGCFILINKTVNNQLINYINKERYERYIENKAYEFYLSDSYENEMFILKKDKIFFKEDFNIQFSIFIDENNYILILKEEC